MDYPIIVDSGANYHMFREKEFFTSLVPAQGKVVLRDGKTTLDIHGIGQIKCMIGPNTLIIDNVRHVPDLAQSIYSLFLHIKQQQHGIQSSFDDGLHLKFPTFTTKTIVGSADIYLDAVPHPDNHGVSEESSIYSDNAHHTCHHTIIHQSNVEPSKDDNLLQSIRQYYAEIKTKQQLNLNLPAGFRSSSSLQKDYNIFAPPCKARSAEVLLPTTETLDQPTTENSTPTIATLSSIESNVLSPNPSSSSFVNVPILRCVDKSSTSLPSQLTFTEDFLRFSVGFRRIDTMKTHLATFYQNTVALDSSPPDAIHDPGDLCNVRKSHRNTTPVCRPPSFGDINHMDIVFGPDIALSNVHYGLLFTDRFSRMTT